MAEPQKKSKINAAMIPPPVKNQVKLAQPQMSKAEIKDAPPPL
jgi:hypothetical protein